MQNNDLEVVVGNLGITLNRELLDSQDAWDNLDRIKGCHKEKLIIYNLMEDTNDRDSLQEFGKNLTKIEFKLQGLWGFPQDIKFHRFWEVKKCRCPKMDNSEAWPTGYYNVAGDCPVHGSSV